MLMEWLHIIIRWMHVFVGILWIGQTHLFSWLDRTMHAGKTDANGSVWMIHSGGFYVVERQKIPAEMPKWIHWFRGEATLTWLTGMTLLILVYWMGGAMVDPGVRDISELEAVTIAISLLIVSWFAYDILALKIKNDRALLVIFYLASVGVAYGLSELLAPRAAFMHVGAMFGSIMAVNVWIRILPAQRKMIADIAGGKTPDPGPTDEAKRRSKHNTYSVIPVIFIMISNHFPLEYGHDHAWAILAGLIAGGWLIAHIVKKID